MALQIPLEGACLPVTILEGSPAWDAVGALMNVGNAHFRTCGVVPQPACGWVRLSRNPTRLLEAPSAASFPAKKPDSGCGCACTGDNAARERARHLAGGLHGGRRAAQAAGDRAVLAPQPQPQEAHRRRLLAPRRTLTPDQDALPCLAPAHQKDPLHARTDQP